MAAPAGQARDFLAHAGLIASALHCDHTDRRFSYSAAALTNTVVFGAANAGLQLANVAITGANKNSSRTDVMAFNINLSSLAQLPANTYTGTLNIQAQATP